MTKRIIFQFLNTDLCPKQTIPLILAGNPNHGSNAYVFCKYICTGQAPITINIKTHLTETNSGLCPEGLNISFL